MIGHLEGSVHSIHAGFAILSVGGVGYKVFATRESLARMKHDNAASVWTHLTVREDVLDLYGFFDAEELQLFELLLTVSGIGSKSALAILDISSVETLRSAVSAGKAEYLTKVSGIGRKTAEKIVLELRDKVGVGSVARDAVLKGDEDALEAMRSLGYSQTEAREALRKVPSEVQKTSERLREALRILGS